MLTTLGSKTRFFILPALALIFLVFGAYGLHPYLHHHSADLASHTDHTGVHCLHNPHCFQRLLHTSDPAPRVLSQGSSGELHDGPCPLCEFLATCSLVRPYGLHLFVSLHYLSCPLGLYYEFHPKEKRKEFLSRGPPLASRMRLA
jgi:hypothetical protein